MRVVMMMRVLLLLLLLLLCDHTWASVRRRCMWHAMYTWRPCCCCSVWAVSWHGVPLHTWLHAGVAWCAVRATCHAGVHVAGRAAAAAGRGVLLPVMAVAAPATRLPAAALQ
jgi:hypothetical protein